jgi:hypothetical protein
MSGQHRLHHEQEPKVNRDRLMFFSMVGFVALGVAISLLFVYYGWTPVDFVAP